MASAKTRTCGEGCRSASSRRPYCVVIKNRGLKSPRLFISTSFRRFFVHRSDAFTHYSILITHCSKASGRREAQRANSRGFLNPWNNWQDKEMASAKTRTCGEGCRSASLQTPLLCNQKTEGLKAPGYSCSRLSDVFLPIVKRSLSRHSELVSGLLLSGKKCRQ